MPRPRALVATPYRAGVLVLTLTALLWRAWLVSRWTWEDDDFLFIPRSQSMSLWSYAFQDHNGHLMPGGFLVTKAIVELAPLSLWPVIVLVSLTSALVVTVWGRALELVSRGSTLAIVPLGLVALSPVMIRPMQWWAVSVNALPMLLCLGLMIIAATRYTATPTHQRVRYLVWMCIVLVGGLFFWHKSVLVVFPTVVVLLALTHGSWRQRLRTLLTPIAALSVIVAIYLVLFFLATRGVSSNNSVEMALTEQTPGSVAANYARGFSQTYLPAMLGGPWGSMPRLDDPYVRQGVAATTSVLVLTGLCATWLALRHRALVWLLALPVGYVVLALGVVQLSSRARAGWDLMTTERYYTDAVAVGAITMALMLGVHRGRAGNAREARRSDRLTPVVIGAFALSLVAGNVVGAHRVGVHPGRDWTATLRAEVSRLVADDDRDQPAVLLDAYAPNDVVRWGTWAEYASLSRILLPFSPDIQFNVATDTLYQVSPQGRVVEAAVKVALRSEAGPDEGCGYAVTPDVPVRIPLSGDLYEWTWIIRVTGYSEAGTDAVLSLGSEEVVLSMPPGLASREIQYVGAVPSSIEVAMRGGDATLCVTDVAVGEVASLSSQQIEKGPAASASGPSTR